MTVRQLEVHLLFRHVAELLWGEHFIESAAAFLGCTPDDVFRMTKGDDVVPYDVWRDIVRLMEDRRDRLYSIRNTVIGARDLQKSKEAMDRYQAQIDAKQALKDAENNSDVMSSLASKPVEAAPPSLPAKPSLRAVEQ